MSTDDQLIELAKLSRRIRANEAEHDSLIIDRNRLVVDLAGKTGVTQDMIAIGADISQTRVAQILSRNRVPAS